MRPQEGGRSKKEAKEVAKMLKGTRMVRRTIRKDKDWKNPVISSGKTKRKAKPKKETEEETMPKAESLGGKEEDKDKESEGIWEAIQRSWNQMPVVSRRGSDSISKMMSHFS